MNIRQFIIAAIPKADSLTADSTFRGRIIALIKKELAAWTTPVTIKGVTNIPSVIRYEVDAYKRAQTGQEEPETGIIRITNPDLCMGKILKTGKIVNYYSKSTVTYWDEVKYDYYKATNRYVLREYNKGFIAPYPGRLRDSTALSEQFGKGFWDQYPDPKKVSSITTARGKITMAYIKKDLCVRLSMNEAGTISGTDYIEFSTKKNTYLGSGSNTTDRVAIEIKKTVNLSTELALAAGEQLHLGKIIAYKNYVVMLVYKHTGQITPEQRNGYTDFSKPADPRNKVRYSCRMSGGSIRGEIIIINRTTWAVGHMAATAHKPAYQTYQSGYADFIIDKKTDNMIIATLSSTPCSNGLSYTSIKYTVAKEDVRPIIPDPYPVPDPRPDGWTPPKPWVDIEFTEEKLFNRWIQQGYSWTSVNIQPSPWTYRSYTVTKVGVESAGSKTWLLDFPLLDVSLYKIDLASTTFVKVDTYYTETSNEITSKNNKGCVGGYRNVMLTQDLYDEKDKIYPIYIGREYDTWLQFPLPSGFTITPELVSGSVMNRDTTKYLWDDIPGDILGMFGMDYFKLDQVAKTMTPLYDVPGGTFIPRTAWQDEPPGAWTWTRSELSTVESLLLMNDYVEDETIIDIKTNSIFHTFTGGPGTTRSLNTENEYIWGFGLYTNGNRFAVIRDKNNKDLPRLLITGAREPMTYMNRKAITRRYQTVAAYYRHTLHDWYGMTESSNNGLYLLNKANNKLSVSGASATYPSKRFTNNTPYSNWYAYKYGFTAADQKKQITWYTAKLDIVLLDYYITYLSIGGQVMQSDYYESTYSGSMWDDTLLYTAGRQSWTFKDNAWDGWETDTIWNASVTITGYIIAGDFENENPNLQYY